MPAPVTHRHPSFPATQWSLVLRAGHGSGCAKRLAMEELLRQYLPALRAHLLISRRVPPVDVDDLLQGFVTDKVVEQDLVARADRDKGRFRSFVVVSLDRYVLSQLRLRRFTVRSPAGGKPLPLDGCDPVDPGPHAAAFNRAWAGEVVGAARRRMREECEAAGRKDVWTVFQERVVAPTCEGAEPTPYAELTTRLGLASDAQAANLLVTAKRHFGRALRSVVAEYVGDDRLVDGELRELIGGF